MKQLLITIAAVVLVGCGPSITIHKAAFEGNISAVEQHLAAGMVVNAKGDFGATSLIVAAYQGHKEIVELLLAKGADVNAKARDGNTPLDYANWTPKYDSSEVEAPIKEIATIIEIDDLLRKHGGKRGEELKAEGK